MTAPPKSPNQQETASTPQEASDGDAGKNTLHERILEEIARNPRWRDTTKPGQAFIIGGSQRHRDGSQLVADANPEHVNTADQTAEKDPP